MLNGWRRWRHGTMTWQSTPAWSAAVPADWPAWILDAPVTDRFHAKQGRSTGRWVVPGPASLVVYLKRHYELPIALRLRALLGLGPGVSPAFVEAGRLETASRLGIPVPETLMAAEWVGPGLRLRSALALAELTGQWALNEALPRVRSMLSRPEWHVWKRQVAAETARLTALLHTAGWFHQDLYLCHFYVRLPGPGSRVGRGDVYLIDLGRLCRRRWFSLLVQVKDLAQLLYSSWIDGVTARDRLRWWRHYTAARGLVRGSWWECILRRLVAYKAGRYGRHNQRHGAVPLPSTPPLKKSA